MIRIILLLSCLMILHVGKSQIHEVPKISHSYNPTSLLRLSDGNSVVTGYSESVFNQNFNYFHVGALIDSNGHLLKQQNLPYASLNLFEHNNAIYNMWTDECVCVDCGLFIGDVQSSLYDLNLTNQFSNLTNSFVQYSSYSTVTNGFSHTPTSNIIFQDTSIFFMDIASNSVTSYAYNQNEIIESFRFDENKVLYKNINEDVYIGDTLAIITDTLAYGISIVPINISGHYIVNNGGQFEKIDLNGNIVASFTGINVKDIQLLNNEFYVLRKVTNSEYEIEIRDENFVLVQSIQVTAPNYIDYKFIVPYTNHCILAGSEYTTFSTNLYTEKVSYNTYAPITPSVDIAITDVFLLDAYLKDDSIQTGSTTYAQYKSEVVSLAAIITNNSNSAILTSSYVFAEVDYYHGFGYGCPSYSSVKRYITEGLAPGFSDTVFFDPIILQYSGYNEQRDFCVWTDSPNYKTDNNFTNNHYCSNYTYSNIKDVSYKQFSVYPNPTSEMIFFNFDESITNQTYRIMSMDGKVVMENTVVDNTINLTRLTTGVYLISIFSNGESLGVRKIVKY